MKRIKAMANGSTTESKVVEKSGLEFAILLHGHVSGLGMLYCLYDLLSFLLVIERSKHREETRVLLGSKAEQPCPVNLLCILLTSKIWTGSTHTLLGIFD